MTTAQDIVIAIGTNDTSTSDIIAGNIRQIVNYFEAIGVQSITIILPNLQLFRTQYEAITRGAGGTSAKLVNGEYQQSKLTDNYVKRFNTTNPGATILGDLNAVKLAGSTSSESTSFRSAGATTGELTAQVVGVLGNPLIEEENEGSTTGLTDTVTGRANEQLRTNSALTGVDLSCHGGRVGDYGNTQVTRSPGGHHVELNDTPGSERILLKHSNGSGIEIRPDGSILISASSLVFDLQGGMNIIGNGNLNIDAGDVTVKGRGKIKLDAGGRLITKSTHSMELVSGSKYSKIDGSAHTRITGQNSSITVGEKSEVNLSGSSISTKGESKILSEGNMTLASAGPFSLSSQIGAYMSSPSTRINGNKLQIIGSSGTIGGDNIIMYNYNMYTDHTITAGDTLETRAVHADRVNATSMHATTFHGDLTGRADTAIASDTANYASSAGSAPLGSAGSPSGWTNNNTTADDVELDDKETFRPTSDIVNARMKTLGNGIREVQIDVGDYIRDQLDHSERHGLSTRN